jgi:hypothetical protein
VILPSPGKGWDARAQAEAHQILMQADAQNLKRGGDARLNNLTLEGSTLIYTATTFTVRGNTDDASDTQKLSLVGGGLESTSRGALVLLHGNEHASSPGRLHLYAGLSGHVRFRGDMLWDTDNTWDIGAQSATRPRNIFMAGYIQSYNAAHRYATFRGDTVAQVDLRWDDNSTLDQIVLSNGDGTNSSFGSRIVFKRSTQASGGTLIEAGAIRLAGEATWTTTASTQDAAMIFYVAVDGVSTEKLRIGTASVRLSAALDFATNNTYDIGTSGNHPRNIYLAGQLDCSNVGQFDINSAVGTVAPIRFNREGGTGGIALYQGNTTTIVFSVDNSGIVNAAGHYRVDGTQVVTNRQAAVADASATVASVQTQLNALLARLRTHGLIAP